MAFPRYWLDVWSAPNYSRNGEEELHFELAYQHDASTSSPVWTFKVPPTLEDVQAKIAQYEEHVNLCTFINSAIG